MNKEIGIKKNKRNGFTLLLSLLVISIILSVSFGVFDVMTKELKLSGIGRESQISFYAADAGVECAYYWDIKHLGKADSYFLGNGEIDCAGNKNINFTVSELGGGKKETSFEFDMGKDKDKNQKCAKVKVTKTVGNSADGKDKITTTIIESKGYNYSCNSTSRHKVERAIRVISTKTEKL